MNELEKYYNKFNEDKRLKSRHGIVEFSVATRYIDEVIAKTGKPVVDILDVGAGTGAYSVFYADKGHNVTAIELVNKNVSQIKMKSSKVIAKQGNALDLKLKDESFDIVLLFGPNYHLMSHEEKLEAILEAKRVVRKNGYILIMYLMNEYAVITYAFKEGHLSECLNSGMLNENFECKTTEKDLYSYVRLEEINKLQSDAKLSRYKIIGVDGATDYIRPVINNLSQKDFETFIRYQESIAERPELLGASSHVLDILKKE